MKRLWTRALSVFLCMLMVGSCFAAIPVSAASAQENDGLPAFQDDFESYGEGDALQSSADYAAAAGMIVASGDGAHGKVLAVPGDNNLIINAKKADKTLSFDYYFTAGSTFASHSGLFVKHYFNAGNDIYGIFSPTLAGRNLSLSSNLPAEGNGFANANYAFQNGVWYKAKLDLDGAAVSLKTWPADEAEPEAWTLHGTTGVVTVDEGSQVKIEFVNAGGSAFTTWIDNLKIEYGREYTVSATCDTEIGEITGVGGTYQKGTEVTFTAAVKEAYQEDYRFAGWVLNGDMVSTDAAYTFPVECDGVYKACFYTLKESPAYTYYEDDFEAYKAGPANKETMPPNFISFAPEGNYQIVEAGGSKALQGTTYSTGNVNLFFMDCEIVDKEISFDFCYDKAFQDFGGLYVKLHSQPSETRPAGDQYYFSITPQFTTKLNISCNDADPIRGLNSITFSDGTELRDNTWYSVKGQLVDNEIRIKIWPRETAEPAGWTSEASILGAAQGFTPTAEGSSFGMELFNASSDSVNVQVDNIVMKTWRKLPEKAHYNVEVDCDTDRGSVQGGGEFLDGNSATILAVAARGWTFTGWENEAGEIVSTEAEYTFTVRQNVKLTAVFEETPVVIRSFMAEGLTQAAVIDAENKTVSLRFASDVDLANVYPYFYLDAGVAVEETCYTRMDLSSGAATVGEGEQQWTITAVKNQLMRTIYVDGANGSDDNDGTTASKAFRTLERAKAEVRSIGSWTGDVVVQLAKGEYNLENTLTFTKEDSAPKGYAVIWQGTSDANDVVITSGLHLDGAWTQSTDVPNLKDGLTAWEYDAAGLPYSRDLYVDGELAQLAVYTLNEDAIGSWALTDVPQLEMTGTGYLATGDLANMYQWHNPTDIEFVYEVAWTYSILPVTAVEMSGGSSAVTMKPDAFYCARNKAGVQIQDPNYIQNCFEGLDSAGEWYFDRAAQKIYYIAGTGEDPNGMRMTMPTLDQLITVNGQGANKVYGMTLKDMTFAYTAYLRPHTDGQVEAQASYLVNPEAKDWNYFHKHDYYIKTDGGVTASYVEGMRVSGCIFTNMAASGFDFEEGCVGCQFVGNNVTNMCGNGLSIGGVAVRDAQPYAEGTYVNGVWTPNAGADPNRVTQYTLVLSNRFQGIGLRYRGSIGIFAGFVSDTTIAHNTIRNASYSGISVGWGWGYWDGKKAGARSDQNAYGPADAYHVFDTSSIQARYVVENNDISVVCQRLADGGTVYSLSNMPGSKLCGNYMHDSPVPFGGVYFDEATGGFTEITDNILYAVHTNYFYHLVGGLTDRESAMQTLWKTGRNYLGVAPGDEKADDNYNAVKENAGTLDAIAPPEIVIGSTAKPVTGVTLNASSAVLKVGERKTLTATVTPANADNQTVTWISSNESVATVTAGVVTGIGTGTATITVTTADGGYTATCTVTVEEAATPPTPVQHTVTFQTNGGSSISSVEVEDGQSVSRPADPTRSGYTFAGWYQDEALEIPYDFTAAVAADLTLYAKWTEASNPGGTMPGGTMPGGSTSGSTTPVQPAEEETPAPSGSADVTIPAVTPDENGEAKASVTDAQLSSAITEAKDENRAEVVIKAEVDGDASKVSVEVPKSSVSSLVRETEAALTVETDVADVKIPAESLKDLTNRSGSTVTISAEIVEDAVQIEVKVDDVTVKKLSGGVVAKIPAETANDGNVLAIVNADGSETIVKKSVVDDDIVAGLVDGSCTVKIVENDKTFADTENHWAEEAVAFAASHELFQGTSSTQFTPNAPMSRAMLATVLYRLEDAAATGSNRFADVPDDTWYTDAVTWASREGIVTGTGNGFDPNGNVTREQLATMLYRYAKSIGMNTYADSDLSRFTDSGKVSGWAEDALAWAVSNGLITGKSAGTLDPTGSATRAEVATILQRLVTLMVR